jgi:sortase (surface protein transpeptidase)
MAGAFSTCGWPGSSSRPASVIPSSHPHPSADVPIAKPARLRIPAIGVDASIEEVGVIKDPQTGASSIDIPHDTMDGAWYNGSVRPGQAGDSLIDGHLDWVAEANRPAGPRVFARLKELKVGDQVIVRTEGNAELHFRVDNSGDLPAGKTPDWMLARSGLPQLTLVTCEGVYTPGSGYSLRRFVRTTSTLTSGSAGLSSP